jgi:4-hydroxy-4-methyl-2-oxoglutarate aldolase
MSSTIYRRIPEIDPALLEEAAKVSVADLHESMDVIPGRMALMDGSIRPLNPGQRIAGQAVTAYTFPGDGLLGHKAVSLVGPGQILVFANGGSGPQTMFAELIALAALSRGAAGAVVESCVRDTEALRTMRFPVWSRGVYPARTGKSGPGAVNVPITVGGVRIDPGDVIVADDDGVICIPPALLPEALEKAKARAAREVKIRAAIAEGKLLFDLLGLQATLDAAGAQEFDTTWKG